MIREKSVPNKHRLTKNSYKRFELIDHERIHRSPFWRNDVVKAWCLSYSIGDKDDEAVMMENGIWLGFYDTGKIELHLTAYGGMTSYNFDKFYDAEAIENNIDWNTHCKLLQIYNWLLDEGIVRMRKKS